MSCIYTGAHPSPAQPTLGGREGADELKVAAIDPVALDARAHLRTHAACAQVRSSPARLVPAAPRPRCRAPPWRRAHRRSVDVLAVCVVVGPCVALVAIIGRQIVERHGLQLARRHVPACTGAAWSSGVAASGCAVWCLQPRCASSTYCRPLPRPPRRTHCGAPARCSHTRREEDRCPASPCTLHRRRARSGPCKRRRAEGGRWRALALSGGQREGSGWALALSGGQREGGQHARRGVPLQPSACRDAPPSAPPCTCLHLTQWLKPSGSTVASGSALRS